MWSHLMVERFYSAWWHSASWLRYPGPRRSLIQATPPRWPWLVKCPHFLQVEALVQRWISTRKLLLGRAFGGDPLFFAVTTNPREASGWTQPALGHDDGTGSPRSTRPNFTTLRSGSQPFHTCSLILTWSAACVNSELEVWMQLYSENFHGSGGGSRCVERKDANNRSNSHDRAMYGAVWQQDAPTDWVFRYLWEANAVFWDKAAEFVFFSILL